MHRYILLNSIILLNVIIAVLLDEFNVTVQQEMKDKKHQELQESQLRTIIGACERSARASMEGRGESGEDRDREIERQRDKGKGGKRETGNERDRETERHRHRDTERHRKSY